MSLKVSEVQSMSLFQNELSAIYQTVDAVIKTEAQKGNFTVIYTLVGAGNIALGPNIVEDLRLRGFTATFDTPDLEISWSLPA